jgi:hypothetical protein
MTGISCSILLIASLCLMPAGSVFAQSNNSHDAGGVPESKVATPTYPPNQASNPALSPCRFPREASNVPAAENPNVSGATGHTVVPGDKSSIGRDRVGTTTEKTGAGTNSSGGSAGR